MHLITKNCKIKNMIKLEIKWKINCEIKWNKK